MSVRPSVRQSGEVSGHLPENAWREWPEILHADVSWPSSELISLWPWSVDLTNFGTILTEWNGSNLGFPGISWRTHGGNGLKFCMLMYLDHLQNWFVYGHGVLIFLILALFWLSETGQIWGFRAFSQRTHRGNVLKFCMLMYLDHLQNWLVLGHGLLIFVILALFWLFYLKLGYFRAFPGERMEGIAWNMVYCCILTTLRTD